MAKMQMEESKLWGKLPNCLRWNKTVRADIKDSSDEPDPYAGMPEWVEKPIEEANMITSIFQPGTSKIKQHIPVLDIDFGAELIPSSTPGHFHLVLDRVMSHDNYMGLLEALAKYGIIQHGFLEGAKKRGATSVRLPWIKKGDKKANMLDPDKDVKRIKEAIAFHKAILDSLEKELGKEESPEFATGGVFDPDGFEPIGHTTEGIKLVPGDIYLTKNGEMQIIEAKSLEIKKLDDELDSDVEW